MTGVLAAFLRVRRWRVSWCGDPVSAEQESVGAGQVVVERRWKQFPQMGAKWVRCRKRGWLTKMEIEWPLSLCSVWNSAKAKVPWTHPCVCVCVSVFLFSPGLLSYHVVIPNSLPFPKAQGYQKKSKPHKFLLHGPLAYYMKVIHLIFVE